MTSLRGTIATLLPGALALGAALNCAVPQRPKELVVLEELRADPTLTGLDRRVFYLLTAAEHLRVRASNAWQSRNMEVARRHALMSQIKMKTAVAILQTDNARLRLARLDTELALTQEQDERLNAQLAVLAEEIALLGQLRAAKNAAAEERKTFAEEIKTARRQAASDRQKALEQLAAEKARAGALDAIRGAELAVRIAETVDAPQFAHAQHLAAISMLREVHKEFGAGRWDDATVGANLVTKEAESAAKLARPDFEKAAAATLRRARDRSLEADASALAGVTTRLERDGDLQRLVLLFSGLFADGKAVLVPAGGQVLDEIGRLLTEYPTYPAEVTGWAVERENQSDNGSLALARANAVFWALVARGCDPRRLSVDVKRTTLAPGASLSNGRVRIELTLLYHITQ